MIIRYYKLPSGPFNLLFPTENKVSVHLMARLEINDKVTWGMTDLQGHPLNVSEFTQKQCDRFDSFVAEGKWIEEDFEVK